jgi:hypothetical protein
MIAADAMHAVKRQRAQQQQVACGLWVEVFWGDVVVGFGKGGGMFIRLRFSQIVERNHLVIQGWLTYSTWMCLLSSSLRYPRLPSSCVPIF